jgi:hypothetical protein
MARWWMDSTPTWAAVINGTWAVTGNGTLCTKPDAKCQRRGSGQLNADWGLLWQAKELTGHGAAPSVYWDAWNAWVHNDPVRWSIYVDAFLGGLSILARSHLEH